MTFARSYIVLALLATVVTLSSGCKRDTVTVKEDKPSQTASAAKADDADQLAAPAESPEAEKEEPASRPSTPTPADYDPRTEINAAHILVMHTGSQRVPDRITRTKAEALERINEITEKLKAEDADFAALAKEYSDCPSGADGGNLGNFRAYEMDETFSDAAMKLTVGQISDIVETPFGYHLIRRQELEVIPTIGAKHILVQHVDSLGATPEVTRTKEEAKARIEECLKRYEAGDKFEDLAREYSACPSKARGGDLGEFPKGMMHPDFEKAAFECEVGKATGIVETPFGYHLILRYK